MSYFTNALILILNFVLFTFIIKKKLRIFEIKREAIAIAEKGVPSPNTVMVDEKSNEPPKKKLNGLAAILKHNLSLPTMEEITSEEKVE